MAEVRRSLQAEQDLEIILEDLSQRGPALAERFATGFNEKSQLLARFPEMGRLRPEIATNLRSTLVDPYVLFYRLQGDVVQIIRILHGKRDLRSIMQAEPEG
jgi:toxin ParE1/3/4